jgi:hypothetical protein
MNLQFKAVWEAHQFFATNKIPYVIMGRLAVQRWGEPRFTRDVDITILVSKVDEERILKKILSVFSPRISDALKFALEHRVCLVRSKDGCEIDISLGIPGYEEEVIKRAIDYHLGGGRMVGLCCAEDLIIHKAVAGRPQDCADIEGIILRQGTLLDENYIHKWLKDFSRLLGTKEIMHRFERPWKQLTERKN